MKTVARLSMIFLSLISISAYAETALIAVASNMSHAIRDIANEFQQQTSLKIKLSLGSSGNLTHQILNGSPHQLFLSANIDYVNELQKKNKTQLNAKTYAIGSLCLYVPKKSQIKSTTDLDKVLSSIQFGRYRKIVLANPLIAPYGNAAIQALQNSGIWSFDQDKLVIAENVSQAAQFALTASVDLAFIPLSHFTIEKIKTNGKCIAVPENLHKPIMQTMVLTQKAGHTAKLFYNFMSSDIAKSILINYGYRLPAP